MVRKMANACVVPPHPRRVRQESANTTTETFMAGNYAKITERGCGQHQRFVSLSYCKYRISSFTLLVFIAPVSPNVLVLCDETSLLHLHADKSLYLKNAIEAYNEPTHAN